VLSTWPAALISSCARKVFDSAATYGYLQGTSMAAPYVTGVAAHLMSTGVTSPGAVAAKINNTAAPMSRPDTALYAPFPAVDNGAPRVCQGGMGDNSFNGHGQVNAREGESSSSSLLNIHHRCDEVRDYHSTGEVPARAAERP
jgi:lantibiotic leader peptide-processing serine protease